MLHKRRLNRLVAGHLSEKKGYYYAVISFNDSQGKRKTKWYSTGLPVKGNKKKAEAMLTDIRCNFKIPRGNELNDDMLFSDYLEVWLTIVKSTVAVTTYSSYCSMVRNIIAPFFREKNITLQDLKAKDIQEFYLQQLDRVKATSVIHYHANIHKALKYAVKIDLIDSNPADKVERPKKEKFVANYYKSEDINKLLEVSKGTHLEIPVLLAAFYGLRRSEVIGLKWDAIDFENNTIVIKHTVTKAIIDGRRETIISDTTKTKSSRRSLPLVDFVKQRLLLLQQEQERNRYLCGRCYNNEYDGYLCVNEIGDIISPDYVSKAFKQLLRRNNLKEIRFHDLRHSCASMLLANGVPMKQIQEWLGHSDYSTTANYYAHLDFSSKLLSADAMLSGLGIETTKSSTY